MQHLTLIHTNDLHSRLDRWPQVATVVQQETGRALAEGRAPIYLDAGDFLDMGEQTCYLTRGQVSLALLAAAGCQALALGNNEIFRFRPSELAALAMSSPVPILCANLRDAEGAPIPGVRDWILLGKTGIFSLSDYYPQFAGPMGYTQTELRATARRCVAGLREAGADAVILLSHLGLAGDREVAAAGLGIDAIVGGHNHQALEQPEVVAGVPIVQAGGHGSHVGRLDVETGRGRLIPTGDAAPDAQALQVLDRYQSQVEERLNEVLAVLAEPYPPERLGALLAEVLRLRAGAEIGLVTGAAIDRGLEAGPVTLRDVMAVTPAVFPAGLLEVPGRNLQAMLAQSRDPAITSRRCGVGGARPPGKPIGPIYASRLPHPTQPERVYRAGALTFFAAPEAGYPAFEGVRLLQRYMPDLLHELLAQALREGLR